MPGRISNRLRHHANLILGAPAEAERYLSSLCDSLDIKLANNPDFFAFRMETFGINEARELKLLATRRALTPAKAGQAGRKIFFVSSARMTLEAQNALLKTFEEPFPDTYFFIAAREEGLVVPTLLSRMQIIHVKTRSNLADKGSTLFKEAEEFLSQSIKHRLLFAKRFADERRSLPAFLDDLLLLLRNKEAEEKSVKKVYNIRRFAYDSAVLPRLIIEHLSLML